MATQTGSLDLGAAAEAARTATSYLTDIGEDGVTVHPEGSTADYARIDATGMEVVSDGASVAKFGAGTRIGLADDAHIELLSDGMDLYSSDGQVNFSVRNSGGSHGEWRYVMDEYVGTYGQSVTLSTSTAEVLTPIVAGRILTTDEELERIEVGVRVSLYDSSGAAISTNRPAFSGWVLDAASEGEPYYTGEETMFSGDEQLTWRYLITYDATAKTLSVSLAASHASASYRHVVQGYVGSVGHDVYMTLVDPSLQFGAEPVTEPGSYSVALGQGTYALASNQVVLGKYNLNRTALLELGNGTSDTDRSNAMTVDDSGRVNLIDQEMPTSTPSSTYWGLRSGVYLHDSEGGVIAGVDDAVGYFRPVFLANGRRGVQMETQRDDGDGERHSNPLTLLEDPDGNAYVQLSRAAWLRALGICAGRHDNSTNIAAGAYRDVTVSYGITYSSAPYVVVGLDSTSTAGTFGRVSVAVTARTTTGFTARIFNGDSSARQPDFQWVAIGTPVN